MLMLYFGLDVKGRRSATTQSLAWRASLSCPRMA